MESDGQTQPPSLKDTLFDEAYRFEFFQAVRVLERIYKEREPIGRQGVKPRNEVVRFRNLPSLEFPASDIYEFKADGDGSRPPEMFVSFMGLIGPSGVLPKHMTELVAEQRLDNEYALWKFLDLFSHRLISLFYRAWERYRFTVAFERGKYDEFTDYLFDLIGMGTEGLRGRTSVPDKGLLLYAGLVAQGSHSASAIESAVGDYLRVPTRVEPFTGQWLELDEESLCRLGGANSALGVSTIAGERVWDSQSKFRVVLGPLTLEQFKRLLPEGPKEPEGQEVPGGPDHLPAVEMTRLMAGPELDFDVQLLLRAEEVPDCEVNSRGDARPMLGWTTWLKTREFGGDDSQVILAARA
jgi:type VI secretion system protein ImpH